MRISCDFFKSGGLSKGLPVEGPLHGTNSVPPFSENHRLMIYIGFFFFSGSFTANACATPGAD
jgi:hypothetical protein